jgi:hypothetical protein
MSVTNVNQYNGISSDWAAKNPVLANGEVGFESDTFEARIGDGSKAYLDLPALKLIQLSVNSL